jgi:hypothetical protein
MNHSPGIAEEIRENKELEQTIIEQLCADGHDDLAHSATHLFSGLRSEIQQLREELDKAVNEIKFQVERNDKQRESYFKLESQLVDKDKVIADLKYMLETEQEDAFPIEDCLAIINRYKEADTSET